MLDTGGKMVVGNTAKFLLPGSSGAPRGEADMMALDVLNHAAITHTLRVRYARDDIYTNVGPILLSVRATPFQRECIRV